MRHTRLPSLALVLLAGLLVGGGILRGQGYRSKAVSVYFSPGGGAQAAILEEVRAAEESIHVAMYLFTDRELARTLMQRARNGVEVRVLLDGQQARGSYSQSRELCRAEGVLVRKLTPEPPEDEDSDDDARMHHKFCILDGKVVLTGSYNWTHGAETRNHENLLILRSKPVARAYEQAFTTLWDAAAH